jgi:hypothetical protein
MAQKMTEAQIAARRKRFAKGARQYRAQLAEVGASQLGFARALGLGKRTSQGYAMGETPIPGWVTKILRLVAAGKVTLAELEKA